MHYRRLYSSVGNWSTGTAATQKTFDSVQTCQIAIPTAGRQKITYVLSNKDKLYVFDYQDATATQPLVLLGISFTDALVQRIYEDFYLDVKLTRWGFAASVQDQGPDHRLMRQLAIGATPGGSLQVPVRNDVKLEPPSTSGQPLLMTSTELDHDVEVDDP